MEHTVFSHIANVAEYLENLWQACLSSGVTEIRAVTSSGPVQGELLAPSSTGYDSRRRDLVMRITITACVEKPSPSIVVEPNVIVDQPEGAAV